MDEIFNKTTNIFDVVKVARDMPRRYGKNGELLINYEDTDANMAKQVKRRTSIGGTYTPKPNIAREENMHRSGGILGDAMGDAEKGQGSGIEKRG